MITVTLYYRPGCEPCKLVETDLLELQPDYPHQLVKVNVDSDAALAEVYGELLPVALIGPYRLHENITRQDLRAALGAAGDRQSYLERTDEQFQKRRERGRKLTGTDRFTYWFSRHYMAFFNFFVLLYVGLPFLAPVFMHQRIVLPAQIIYRVYSPLCHQFAFRSWFLFGEQPYYPRSIAGVPDAITYEQIANNSEVDLAAARSFIGNEQVGYKVAFCQRDIAIYGGILLFGLLFSLTGRKVKSLRWYWWLIIGVIPIGLDGTSQLPALLQWPLLNWLPVRESTPILRTITGALFGITTAWYIYPIIEDSMKETRRMMARKIAVVRQVSMQGASQEETDAISSR